VRTLLVGACDSQSHASNVCRGALTARRDKLDPRSWLCRLGEHLTDRAATVVPQRGPRGGRKVRSNVDRRTVEALESAHSDDAPRARIALGGRAAVSAAYHHAHLKEHDTGTPEVSIALTSGGANGTCKGGEGSLPAPPHMRRGSLRHKAAGVG
jgi:hypothetical protein